MCPVIHHIVFIRHSFDFFSVTWLSINFWNPTYLVQPKYDTPNIRHFIYVQVEQFPLSSLLIVFLSLFCVLKFKYILSLTRSSIYIDKTNTIKSSYILQWKKDQKCHLWQPWTGSCSLLRCPRIGLVMKYVHLEVLHTEVRDVMKMRRLETTCFSISYMINDSI